jgi:hypothetical protein
MIKTVTHFDNFIKWTFLVVNNYQTDPKRVNRLKHSILEVFLIHINKETTMDLKLWLAKVHSYYYASL